MSSRGYVSILMLCISLIKFFQWSGNVISSLPSADTYKVHRIVSSSSSSLSFSKSSQAAGQQFPPLLAEALQKCEALKQEFGIYPSVIEHLMELRKKHNFKYTSNAWKLVQDKLGGYVFASLLGIPRPHVLFCGAAIDLPFDNFTESFGHNFVMKPYKGSRRRGVKVVLKGEDQFAANKDNESSTTTKTTTILQELTNCTHLVDEYGENEIVIVEALNQSPDPAWDGLVPPDYKFLHAGRHTNLGYFVDRNVGQSCASYFVPSSGNTSNKNEDNDSQSNVVWGPAGTAVPHGMTPCSNRSDFGLRSKERNQNMIEAVERIADYFNGNYIRIDMFDTKMGPILGEFEHTVGRGANRDLEGCLESYVFLKSAANNLYSDDAKFILQRFVEQKEHLRLDDVLVKTVRPKQGLRHPLNYLPSRIRAHQKEITDRVLDWFLPSFLAASSNQENNAALSTPLLSEVNKLAKKFKKLDARERCQLVLKSQQNDWYPKQQQPLQRPE